MPRTKEERRKDKKHTGGQSAEGSDTDATIVAMDTDTESLEDTDWG